MEDIKNRTRVFLGKYIKNKPLEDHDDIFATGEVNSLFAMQLVMFIEREFGVEIDNNDLDLNNFKSIEAISNLIASKCAAVGRN